jgi:hypothetical protein
MGTNEQALIQALTGEKRHLAASLADAIRERDEAISARNQAQQEARCRVIERDEAASAWASLQFAYDAASRERDEAIARADAAQKETADASKA